MPLASKPGAPRPKKTEAQSPIRRCLGPIDRKRFEQLKADGALTPNDIVILEATFRELEKRTNHHD